MIFPKIIPNTFISNEQSTSEEWGKEVTGTTQVEFEGVTYTVPATRIVGKEIFDAQSFLAKGKTGKTYKLYVTYRAKDDEHDCRCGGGVIKIAKVWKE
jgi:hypothetical protein